MKIVIDTNVIVAAMRSSTGASAALLVHVLNLRISIILSVALALEYEATCTRDEHLAAAGATLADVTNLLAALFKVAEPTEIYYSWRPQLLDAGDEMVLEAAMNGGATVIVTFNRKDYGAAPTRFGIRVLTPGEVLREIDG